jgi:hypothetical protein
MTPLRTKRYVRSAGLILLTGTLLALTGCGKKSSTNTANAPLSPSGPEGARNRPTIPLAPPGKNELTGKISHQGEPIVAGRLFFIHSKGIVMMPGRINQDGTYRALGLPEGDVRIFAILDPEGELPFPSPREPALGPGGPMGPGGVGSGEGYPGGMPGPGRMPGRPGRRPGGPAMPEGGPPTLPPMVVQKVKGFVVPPDKQKLYKQLHEKYGRITEEHKIKTLIKEGTNTLDIDLP